MNKNNICMEELIKKCPEIQFNGDQMESYLTGDKPVISPECKKALKNFKKCDNNEIIEFDSEYLKIIRRTLENGTWKLNERTGKRCLFYHGDMMKFDLSSGYFPLLTTKKMAYKSMVGELIGFLRGVDNAKDFRELNCKFWDANANESEHWLNNPNRKGVDDLGKIYGVQARGWDSDIGKIDQLQIVVDKLSSGIDDRRLIVSHWNVGELHKMALPPCHMQYQFGIRDGHLDMCLYQRSCDLPLGIPMNIASYALLLHIISMITGLKVGVLTHFMWNIHIYEDQLSKIKKQLNNKPLHAPSLEILGEYNSLNDITTKLSVDDVSFLNYEHQGAITFPFSA